MAAEQASALALALVAGGFSAFGVLAKIAYDTLVDRREHRARGIERFAAERREAYDDFLNAVERQRLYVRALHALGDRAREGETELSDAERATFPPSAMPDLVTALARVHRLARGYAAVTSAEAVVRLFGDIASAERVALQDPGPDDEITWFLLHRFLEDRLSEFLHAYRDDLGLGPPTGAPNRWPVVERKRHTSLEGSERAVRAALAARRRAKPD